MYSSWKISLFVIQSFTEYWIKSENRDYFDEREERPESELLNMRQASIQFSLTSYLINLNISWVCLLFSCISILENVCFIVHDDFESLSVIRLLYEQSIVNKDWNNNDLSVDAENLGKNMGNFPPNELVKCINQSSN